MAVIINSTNNTKSLGLREIIGGTEESKKAAELVRKQAAENKEYRASFSLEAVKAFIAERPYLKFLGIVTDQF